jgi:zinc/manganese transport system ATP-binding protein
VSVSETTPSGADAADAADAVDTVEADPAVQLTGAEVRIGGRQILNDLSLTIEPGEFVAVLGPNGAGKSTLMKSILGLVPLAGGTVRVLGRSPHRARAEIGYLPQRQSFDRTTRIRGSDLVQLGLDGARWGVPVALTPTARRRRAQERECVREVIALVGATAYARRPIGELSGGEQQRLLIAAALVRRPRLLILDEPLDSLDLPNQSAVAGLVRRIASEQRVAVLLVAHDVNPLLGHLDRVVYLAAGHAVSGTVREVITTEQLTALYGAPVEVLETTDGRVVVVGQPEAPHHHGHRHE